MSVTMITNQFYDLPIDAKRDALEYILNDVSLEFNCEQCNETLTIKNYQVHVLEDNIEVFFNLLPCNSCTQEHYEQGIADGEGQSAEEQYDAGYSEGYSAGLNEATDEAYDRGHSEGYEEAVNWINDIRGD